MGDSGLTDTSEYSLRTTGLRTRSARRFSGLYPDAYWVGNDFCSRVLPVRRRLASIAASGPSIRGRSFWRRYSPDVTRRAAIHLILTIACAQRYSEQR